MASRLTGNWKGIKLLSQNLDKDLIQNSKEYLNKEAIEIQEEIKDSIYSQSGNWKDLKPKTIKDKGSSDILIETGQLVESIQVNQVNDLKYIIAPEGNHSSGVSNSELAVFHEYGTERIPPRPFIKPIHSVEEPEVHREVSELVGNAINKYK